MSERIVQAELGEAGLRSLVAAFYRRVAVDELIGPMYPEEDLAGAEMRLADFLCFRLLGLPKYVEERGHPRLRARHLPFKIGIAERDRWLSLMGDSMTECSVPMPSREFLSAFFAQVADFMRNHPEDSAA